MTGAEYIAEFLHQRGVQNVFLITGGACAFIVDAIHRHKDLKYTCFQHEQACAMAADSIYRIDKNVGVTVATSGPGATNLITGIACSYFDSIPSFHITGQVNQTEAANFLGAQVRQAGFQETNIVDMVKPITKYAVQIKNGNELKKELIKAWNLAISDRKGPVLLDIPMNVQKEEVGDIIEYYPPEEENSVINIDQINAFFKDGKRPLVLFGAGVGLAGVAKNVEKWLIESKIPFVTSWNGCTYFNHNIDNFYGKLGVYGDRSANFLIQNCDRLLVLGSRLDNRQRSGSIKNFAISGKVMVIDVDIEELKKYKKEEYETINANLKHIPFEKISPVNIENEWKDFADDLKKQYFGKDLSLFSVANNTLSPYKVVQKINKLIKDDAIVVADDGANLCWVFKAFHVTNHILYTAGGNSPMGYSFPASIGAALHAPERQIIAFTGDGSMQMNIQELQTMRYHNLNIKLFILNNDGYGIIKQFQDLYFESRYAATGYGYSCPDFKKIVEAYDIKYFNINSLEDVTKEIFDYQGPAVINVNLHQNTLIEPKLELGKPIHDQYPYISGDEFEKNSKYCKNTRLKD
ncbi:thiamine pyrophosphate-binding protein [Candidatus Deianiraea vastatrix]|uniref:Acetolactate/acetohydroxybutanoate synthase large subunit n=1 Tax=Candidatus Deianiraea vastatrix TaxID=2163644 RepID=A0A5B8XF28_9RICK|nr:thiamine pyrophosphate-binding protein [Candidatus Deianiraea vastatrix]QED23883.1 Acetolactate/acetohydroxybutanoate synthase large subunit [Candidatus Deianiraea vastatrix]